MIEIKGAVIIDTINAVKTRSGEQVFNNILSQLDEQTKLIFSNALLATNWYSFDGFIKFLELDIKFTANGNKKELQKRSEALIEKQLTGIYKIFVKFGSPEFVLTRMSSLHQRYFNGVNIEVTMEGSIKAIIKYIGFSKQHKLFEYSLLGFYKKAMEISGAKNVQIKYLTSMEEDKGFCDLEITWTGK